MPHGHTRVSACSRRSEIIVFQSWSVAPAGRAGPRQPTRGRRRNAGDVVGHTREQKRAVCRSVEPSHGFDHPRAALPDPHRRGIPGQALRRQRLPTRLVRARRQPARAAQGFDRSRTRRNPGRVGGDGPTSAVRHADRVEIPEPENQRPAPPEAVSRARARRDTPNERRAGGAAAGHAGRRLLLRALPPRGIRSVLGSDWRIADLERVRGMPRLNDDCGGGAPSCKVVRTQKRYESVSSGELRDQAERPLCHVRSRDSSMTDGRGSQTHRASLRCAVRQNHTSTAIVGRPADLWDPVSAADEKKSDSLR